MRAVVVYESMYGNTHAVAEAIGAGLQAAHEVVVVPVERAGADVIAVAELLVVGGPTHVHGMTRPRSREAAVEAAGKAGSMLVLEDCASGSGVREWLAALGPVSVPAAAFDTRMPGPPAFTGRASKGIARELARHGAQLLVTPESFLVSKENVLLAGEEPRARQWGRELAAATSPISTA